MTSTDPTGTALRLTGRDALGVLHRISTQALDDLAPGEARATLFCDFRGRLLHRAVAAVAPDGAVWLLRDDAAAAPLAAFVDRHVFREDVAIDDRSDSVRLGRIPDAGPAGAHFDERGPLRAATVDGTALVRGVPGMAAAERIAHGIAAHGAEIAEAFNPFEVGLGAEVHLAKGCFTGQEALQRLITYESVRRALVWAAVVGAPPAPGANVLDGGARAGVVTSAASSEAGSRMLAVVKLEALDAGRALALEDGRAVSVLRRFEMPRALGRP